MATTEYALIQQTLTQVLNAVSLIRIEQQNDKNYYDSLSKALSGIQSGLAQLSELQGNSADVFGEALKTILKRQVAQTVILEDLQTILNQVLAEVTPPLPVQSIITLSTNPTGDLLKMHPKATAGIDLAILDDGTGTATLTFADAAGNAAAIPAGASISGQTWTPSNPALTITPDPSGTFAKLSPTPNPSGPPALATGITITVSDMTLTLASGTTSTIKGSTAAQAVDVVADTPTSSVLALSTP